MQLSFVYVLNVTHTFDNACHKKRKENSNFSKLKILFIRFLQVYIVYGAHSSSQSGPYIFTSLFAPVGSPLTPTQASLQQMKELIEGRGVYEMGERIFQVHI